MNYKHIAVAGYLPTKDLLSQRDLEVELERIKRDNIRELLDIIISEHLGKHELEYDLVKQQHVIKTHFYVGAPHA